MPGFPHVDYGGLFEMASQALDPPLADSAGSGGFCAAAALTPDIYGGLACAL